MEKNSTESRDGLEEILDGTDDIMAAGIEKAVGLAGRYRYQLIAAAAVIVLIAVGFSSYRNMKAAKEVKAADLLSETLGIYAAKTGSKHSEKEAMDAVSDQFNQLFSDYGVTRAGELGKLHYADICFDAGDMETAKQWYSDVVESLGKQSPAGRMALRGLGYVALQSGDDQAAISSFEFLAADFRSAMQDEILFQLGSAYGRVGKKTEMMDTLNQVIRDYPDSMYAMMAKMMVAG